ncbi:MAG: SGNH/GDSL hydrolase family protein [Cyanobacteria bacterium J06635_1]
MKQFSSTENIPSISNYAVQDIAQSSTINNNPVNILPLGDSITQGSHRQDSYRRPLWHLLQQQGYAINFVGSLNTNSGGPSPNPDFDLDHEGRWGWRVDEILNGQIGQGKLTDWLQDYTPDIALVHLGTNDIAHPNSVASTLEELGQVIDVLRADNPSVTILLAQLIPNSYPEINQRIQTLNAQMVGLAANKTQPTSLVQVVDHHSGFDVAADTYDGVHPDESGINKMAQVWVEALSPLLTTQN